MVRLRPHYFLFLLQMTLCRASRIKYAFHRVCWCTPATRRVRTCSRAEARPRVSANHQHGVRRYAQETQVTDLGIRDRIGPRLFALYDLVPAGIGGVCDVGTDHGLLPLALLIGGKVPRAIGIDRCEEPLQYARQNLQEYLDWSRGATEKGPVNAMTSVTDVSDLPSPGKSFNSAPSGRLPLELRLGEGLQVLAPGEADTVTMAGLGTREMTRVLAATAPGVVSGLRHLVLQPYDSRPLFVWELRRWLATTLGFYPTVGRIDQVGSRWFITTLFSRRHPSPSESSRSLPSESVQGEEGVSAPPNLGPCLLDACRRDGETRVVYAAYLRHHEKWLEKLVAARATGGEVEQGLLAAIQEELKIVLQKDKS